MPIYEKDQCEWEFEHEMALLAADVSFRRYLVAAYEGFHVQYARHIKNIRWTPACRMRV